MKFSIKEFFSKCDKIRRKLRIWSHLQKKPSIEDYIFCAVLYQQDPFKNTHRLIYLHTLFIKLMFMSICKVQMTFDARAFFKSTQ